MTRGIFQINPEEHRLRPLTVINICKPQIVMHNNRTI